MEQKETRGVTCPFCGAPYKKFIPSDVLQLKCDYCGATFRTPPRIGVEIPQCYNHPERFAVGICNDCGHNFCSRCLNTFDFKTRDGSALLYLCPDCLRDRYLKKADAYVLSGTLLLIFGILVAIAVWAFGAFLIVIASIEIVYGFSKRTEALEEYKVEEAGAEEKEGTPEPAKAEGTDAELLYDELLTKYVDHWGARTGTELLDNEIKAYIWHGDTFEEAVRKVYRRQEKGI